MLKKQISFTAFKKSYRIRVQQVLDSPEKLTREPRPRLPTRQQRIVVQPTWCDHLAYVTTTLLPWLKS